MTNLTLSVDDGVLEKARIRALSEGRSLNAVLAAFLAEYADEASREKLRLDAIDRLEALSGREGVRVGRISWSRDELHER